MKRIVESQPDSDDWVESWVETLGLTAPPDSSIACPNCDLITAEAVRLRKGKSG